MEDTLGGNPDTLPKQSKSLNPCFNGRYSRSYLFHERKHLSDVVLILVLMEDTLGGMNTQLKNGRFYVLILVLMEDTLGELRLIFLCLSLFEVYLLLTERFS